MSRSLFPLVTRFMSSSSSICPIVLDPFCFRQFDPSSPSYLSCSPNDLLARVNDSYHEQPQEALKPGYAPFCKHIFIPNFIPSLSAGSIPLTADTIPLLLSRYEARRDSELPVLVRYFPKSNPAVLKFIPKAKFLDIILYSREQILKENAAMPSDTKEPDGFSLSSCYRGSADSTAWSWGIVSVKAQVEQFETPMTPITMMRNALGVSEGGSGIPLDREKYMESVKYWSENALSQ
jgi:hypothetical protein